MPIIKSAVILILFITMIFHPQILADSTRFAITTWWDSVLPALLPFFITSEILIHMGIMNCFSLWLEPIMRPIFRLPGCSALALVMGFVSGSPTGANITANLREQGLCTKQEGERLVAFTNNASPLYILVAVSVGILHQPAVGIWLFLSHYPINLLFGILLRFFGKKNKKTTPISLRETQKNGLQAIKTCPTPSLGKLLRISVTKSLINIGVVGGFMVIFSILSAILQELHLLQYLAYLFLPICHLFGIDPSLTTAFASGFWEMTIGIAQMPESNGTLFSQLLAASILLAWNGISIQAQVGSMLHHTDIKLHYYLICRIIHAFLAPIVILIAKPYLPTSNLMGNFIPAWLITWSSPFFLLLFSLSCLLIFIFLGLLCCRISPSKHI